MPSLKFHWKKAIMKAPFIQIYGRLLHNKDLLKDGVLSNRFNNRLEYCFSNQNHLHAGTVWWRLREVLSNSSIKLNYLMEISTLVEPLLVFIIACYAGQNVLSLEFSYPPKIVTDENACFVDWTSSKAVCESTTQSAYKHRLFRYDGKEVYF